MRSLWRDMPPHFEGLQERAMSISALTIGDVMQTAFLELAAQDAIDAADDTAAADQVLIVLSRERFPLLVVDAASMGQLHDDHTRASLSADVPPAWNVPVLTTSETSLLSALALMILEPSARWHVCRDGDDVVGVVSATAILRALAAAHAWDLERAEAPSVSQPDAVPDLYRSLTTIFGAELPDSEIQRAVERAFDPEYLPWGEVAEFRHSMLTDSIVAGMLHLAGDPLHPVPSICYRCSMHPTQKLGRRDIHRDFQQVPICNAHNIPVTYQNPC
jgi:hypothetical protein